MSHQIVTDQTHERSNQSDPVEQWHRHADQYRRIYDNLQATYDYFDHVGWDRRAELLEQAVTFALISAQCGVAQHEAGYANVMTMTIGSDQDAGADRSIGEALRDAGVNYWRNKARYIEHNHRSVGSDSDTDGPGQGPDVDRVLDHYEHGRIDEMHRAIADEYLGVGLRKAGFAMALSVNDQKMCIDTHVAESAGLDADDIYNGVVVDKYERQCERVLAQYPRLCDLTGSPFLGVTSTASHDRVGERGSPFLSQWVLFDSQRGELSQHDPWFLSLPEAVDIRW